MQIDRRQLAFPVLALGLLSAVPAFAGADEDAIAKNLEAFRAAQAAGNTEVIASICAEELSYSHSNAKIDTKASLLNGIATANYKWTSLEYKDPTIRVVGPAAIVRFNFVGEQEFTDGKKTPQNLHILRASPYRFPTSREFQAQCPNCSRSRPSRAVRARGGQCDQSPVPLNSQNQSAIVAKFISVPEKRVCLFSEIADPLVVVSAPLGKHGGRIGEMHCGL